MEEKTQAEIIEEIISRKLKPIYWSVGIMVAIFVGVSGPLTTQVLSNSLELEKKLESDEAYNNFITKGAFHILQKDEHISDVEAIRNPGNADIIYLKQNSSEAERLNIGSRSGSSVNKHLK